MIGIRIHRLVKAENVAEHHELRWIDNALREIIGVFVDRSHAAQWNVFVPGRVNIPHPVCVVRVEFCGQIGRTADLIRRV